jgi:hypothetical protein
VLGWLTYPSKKKKQVEAVESAASPAPAKPEN